MLRRHALTCSFLPRPSCWGSAPLVAPPAGAQAAGKVLRVQQGLRSRRPLDPQRSGFPTEVAVSGLDYEGLTRLDADLATVPAAAESWDVQPRRHGADLPPARRA